MQWWLKTNVLTNNIIIEKQKQHRLMQDASSSYMTCKPHPLILKTCILSHQKLTTQLDSLDSSTKEACYGKSFIKNNFSHLHNRFSKWNEFLVHLQHQTMWLETCTARKKNFESQLLVLFHLWILWGKQKKHSNTYYDINQRYKYWSWDMMTNTSAGLTLSLPWKRDLKTLIKTACSKNSRQGDYNWQKFFLKHIL